MKSEKIKFLFWATIVLGIVLPIITMIAVDLILNRVNFIVALQSAATFFLNGYGLILILHDVPFLALAFVIKSRLREKVDNSEPYILRLSETIGAWSVTFFISLLMNLDVWIGLARLSPGFSTGFLAYFFFPFYGIVAILLGYGCGWFIGKVILWYKV